MIRALSAVLAAAGCAALIATAAGAQTPEAPAPAQDHEAGVPLTPQEAAGVWTLSSGGHDLCAVTLEGGKSAVGAYAASSDAACQGVLPAPAAGWRPTADGMALIGRNGQPLVAFGRWSNSLFVSHRDSGVDLQLRRGQPHPEG